MLITGFVSDDYKESFLPGEQLYYKMTYGFFTIGKGKAEIYPQTAKVSNRDCYRVEVTGRTVGMVDWVADINDQFTAYVDTTSLLPLQFYRKIREGNYKKDECTNFDQVNHKIEVT